MGYWQPVPEKNLGERNTWVIIETLVANTDSAFVSIGSGLEFCRLTTCNLVLWTVYGVDMGSTLGPLEAHPKTIYTCM
jgi:hypothetical protein